MPYPEPEVPVTRSHGRRGLGPIVALVLSSCAAAPQAPPSPSPARSPAPLAVPSPADERVAITGHLLAYDGTPLRRSELVVRRAGASEPVAHAVLDRDGRVRVEVPPGAYWISITAAGHGVLVRHTLVADALHVEGRLGTWAAPGHEPRVQWTGERAATAAVIAYHQRWLDALHGLNARFPLEDGELPEKTDELRAELEAMAAKAREQADAAPDPTTHGLLRMAYLAVFGPHLDGPQQAARRREDVAWVVEHVPATEPHLALLIDLDDAVILARRDGDEASRARIDAWLEQRAREHADPTAALGALKVLLADADERGDVQRADELYPLVLDERLGGASLQRVLQAEFDPGRILRRGKPFPAFDFPPLHEGEPRVTSTDREGRLYLLEFWATYCEPCVAEMPTLHAAYVAINHARPAEGRGEAALRRLRPVEHPRIELVSISLDGDPSEVDAFREQHWSMPWTHGFVGRAGEAEVMARYGFSGVPMIVLVDETGTIIEVERSLRGEQLLPTLERVLARREGQAPR